jgi:hypothetical protein
MANFGVATCSLPRAGARVVQRAAVTEGIAMRFRSPRNSLLPPRVALCV